MSGTFSAPPSRPLVLSDEYLAREDLARERLRAQGLAMLAGTPELAPRSPQPEHAPSEPKKERERPISGSEALKALGLYRKSVRAKPVVSGYTPQRVSRPVAFPLQPGQQLTKLSRTVGREWTEVLVSVSSARLAGGRLTGAQGRNLIRIVETLRKHCFLKLDRTDQPVEVREQVVQVVDGAAFCFARECGMSEATFYRALRHPLAHLFLRTQKVQRIEAGTEARRNVATLFSVALYEPLMPAVLEDSYWAVPVEEAGEFIVPYYVSQGERTKGRLETTQEQNGRCGKLTDQLRGASAFEGSQEGRERFLQWVDQAALISKAGHNTPSDLGESNLEGCIDKLRNLNPGLWEFAVQIAIHHDDPDTRAVAAIGYYKALIHLGVPKVRYWVQRLEKWRLKGQKIETPGRLLMHHLNKAVMTAMGFPIRDLGTEKGQHLM